MSQLRSRLIRLAKQDPNVAAHLRQGTLSRKSYHNPLSEKQLMPAYRSVAADAKNLLGVIARINTLAKRISKATGYKGRATKDEADKMLEDLNGFRASAWKMTRNFIDKMDHLPNDPMFMAEPLREAKEALQRDSVIKAEYEVSYLLDRVSRYYDLVRSVGFQLADLTGQRPLPDNPYKRT